MIKKPKLLIVGHARHGKDTMAEILNENFEFSFMSSSQAASDIFIFDALKDSHGYTTPEECFEDRINHRAEWYDLITEYNSKDKARLAKEILKQADCYVGMRNPDEIAECKKQGIFDLIVWVDASKRLPLEPESSMKITQDEADIIIDNNSSLEKFKERVMNFGNLLYQPKTKWYLRKPLNVYVDIDGVIANTLKKMSELCDIPEIEFTDWDSGKFHETFKDFKSDPHFWLSMESLVSASAFSYPIKGYVTHRSIPKEITEQWIIKNNLPLLPIIQVEGDKSRALRELNCDVFIDDCFHNFQEINTSGIKCYLHDAPHNRKYGVDREDKVFSLYEFCETIKKL